MKHLTNLLCGLSLGAVLAGDLSAATLSGGFAGLYADALGASAPVDIVVPVPAAASGASISFERDDTASGSPAGGSGSGSISLNGVSRTLVSVPTTASPQVDVSTQAVATRPPDSSRTGAAFAVASAVLAYEARISQTATPAGLTFGSVPITANIFTFLSAETSEAGGAGKAFASGLTEVQLSDRRITVGPRATLVAEDPTRVDALFATVNVDGAGKDVFDPGLTALDLDLPVDTSLWVAKRATARAGARISSAVDFDTTPFFNEATAFATAVVDPVLVFDQVRFQSQ